MKVQIFIPCFVDQLYPQTAFNMVKVLEKACCDVYYNPAQTCCGQPAFNAGFRADCKEVASKFLDDFENQDYIVTPSASCAGFVKNYYPLLFDNTHKHNQARETGKRLYEFSSFLTEVLKMDQFGAKLEGIATYHDSCAALRECGIRQGPRQLLANVKGLELREMEDRETCCGFGGTFAVKFQEISMAMAEQKIEFALQTGARYLISTDLSCLMHLEGIIRERGLSLQTLHLADVLASGWAEL